MSLELAISKLYDNKTAVSHNVLLNHGYRKIFDYDDGFSLYHSKEFFVLTSTDDYKKLEIVKRDKL